MKKKCVNNSYTLWTNVIYDSVWALAVAFNQLLDEFKNKSRYLKSAELQKEIAKMLQISILDVDFQGATGRTKFDKQTRFIEPQLNLLQYNGRGRSEVKMIYCDGDLNILPAGRKVHFIDSSFERKHRHIPLSATLSIMICSSLILLLVVTVQLMNIIHRNYKSIKATSHRLNHIVLVGFYLVITGVVAFTVQKTVITLSTNVQTLLCHTVPWCISIGLTLILGTESLKTWCLYWIFNRTNQSQFKSIILKDFTLCKIVSVIAFLDVLVLISWSIGDPLLPDEKMNQNSDGTIIIESQLASAVFSYTRRRENNSHDSFTRLFPAHS